MAHIEDVPNEKSINGNIFFANSDILEADTLNPFSHVYMFDVGFPPELHCSIAQLFNNSLYTTHLVSYKQPRYIIDEYGFQVSFMHQCSTSMHGMYNIIKLF